MKKRVKIPVTDAQALITLVRKVRAKHVEDGESSPLKVLDWSELNHLIDDAANTFEQANMLKREKRRIYQLKNQKMAALRDMARSSRDILSGVYRSQEKELGSWGFDVLNTKITPAEPQPTEIVKTS